MLLKLFQMKFLQDLNNLTLLEPNQWLFGKQKVFTENDFSLVKNAKLEDTLIFYIFRIDVTLGCPQPL